MREKLLPRKELGNNMLSKNGLAEKIFAHGGDGKHDLEHEEDGAKDVAQAGVGEDIAQAEDGEEDLA